MDCPDEPMPVKRFFPPQGDMLTTSSILKQRYHIQRKLGEGGMGQVYLAVDTVVQGLVAIKRIVGKDEQMVHRLEREYRILQMISHPNVVKALDFFQETGQWFLVMEFVPGISLKEYIQTNPDPPLHSKLAIANQICRAVEIINTAGILHRDLKPANVMVNKGTKQVKLVDMGLVKKLVPSKESLILTQKGNIVGTTAYLSPEQISGGVSEKSDVFSLGIVLYQLFTWSESSPFQERSGLSTMIKISEKEVPPLESQLKKKPSPEEKAVYLALSRIIAKSMIKEVNKRLSSAKEMGDEMERLHRQSLSFVSPGNETSWSLADSISPEDAHRLKQMNARKEEDWRKPTRRIKKREGKKGHPVSWAVTLAVIFAGLLFASLWGVFSRNDGQKPKEFAKVAAVSRSPKDVIQSCARAIEFFKGKKYADCLEEMKALDDYAWDRHELRPSDPLLTRFLYFFYNQKWKDALKLAPALLDDNSPASGVGIFFCLRLFICVGEYHLAYWYADSMKTFFPDFCQESYHPLFDIFTRGYYAAFQKLSDWNPSSQSVRMEKAINHIYLRMIMVHPVSHPKFNFQAFEKVWRALSRQYKGAMPEWLDDFFGAWAKDQIKLEGERSIPAYRSLLAKCPWMMEPRYRISMIGIEKKGDFASTQKNMEDILTAYPTFYPAKLILGTHSMNEHARHGRILFIRYCLYHVILGCLISRKYQRANDYARLLHQDHSEWHFSHVYVGESAIACNRWEEGTKLMRQGFRMKVDSPNIAMRYLKVVFQQGDLRSLSDIYWRIVLLPPGESVNYVLNQIEQSVRFTPRSIEDPFSRNLIESLREFRAPSTAQKMERYEQLYKAFSLPERHYWGPMLLGYLFHHGEYDRAISCFRQMDSDLETLFSYHFLKAICYLEKSKKTTGETQKSYFNLCFQEFKKAFESDPLSPNDYLIWYKIREFLFTMADAGEFSRAHEVLDWSERFGNRLVEEKIYVGIKSKQDDERLLSFYDLLVDQYTTASSPSRFLERAEICIRLKRYKKARADLQFAHYLFDVGFFEESLKESAKRIMECLRETR